MTDNDNDPKTVSTTPLATVVRRDPEEEPESVAYSNNAILNLEIENERDSHESERHPEAKPATTAPVSKKSGNKNALRHGAHFNGLLPWESAEEFQALHERFMDDYKPQGALQEETVLSLSQWWWKRRRVLTGSQISYFRSPVTQSLKAGDVTWDDVVQYQAKVPELIQTLVSDELKFIESLRAVGDRISNHYYWTNTTEGKDIQMELFKMRGDVSALVSDIREHVFDENKSVHKVVKQITNLFDDAYQPDKIEKDAQLLAMIDREIDKTIKRLIFLKTFTSVEAEKTRELAAPATAIESPSVIPPETSPVKEPAEIIKSTEATEKKLIALAAPEHRGKPEG
jgi:hypothetical protein